MLNVDSWNDCGYPLPERILDPVSISMCPNRHSSSRLSTLFIYYALSI